ncbi:MAG: DNA methylase, partial [Clostridia bacterium]|nr:DNA methylase [Clostridia bacterium]
MKPLAELLDSLRHMESFPIGKDEDILALSDPPYYTACPNPYFNDFIERYGKPYDPERDDYHRTPFVGDISEGKNDPIYNAHSYHTKVPHKAIRKFIEHYTKEGDIVFDGFCGSGMTGVAAQLSNRRAVLVDLSPAATFIAYNYNTPVDIAEFEKEANRILEEIEKECGWMYETLHTDGKTRGRINYTVWSDVFICPYCHNEYVFWHAAVGKEKGKVLKEFSCPECRAEITKTQCERAKVNFYDQAIGQEITQAKQVPVLINYSVGKKRFEKEPDKFDLDLIQKIEESTIPYWFPTNRMPEGDESRRNDRLGVTHVHHFYTYRTLWVLSYFNIKIKNIKSHKNLFTWLLTASCLVHTKMYSFRENRKGGIIKGTLYISSLYQENMTLRFLKDKVRLFKRIYNNNRKKLMISAQDAESVYNIPNSSIDYIFTDPPFGDNLMYSELNFLWEAWLKVFTNNQKEAIVNNAQNKGLSEYKELMTACFREMFRILKPNRWMTVVFHNSKASVWNAIQDAITKAGFVIAQVTVMDKQQGSFKQVTSAG